MISYIAATVSHPLSPEVFHSTNSWPVIAFTAAAIILMALVFAYIATLVPRHEGRYVQAGRHVKPEITPLSKDRLR